MTEALSYDCLNKNRNVALIFNHESFENVDSKREGTRKDGNDLKNVLQKLQFDVRLYMDLKLNQVRDILHYGKTLFTN